MKYLLLLVSSILANHAQSQISKTYTVNGVERKALIYNKTTTKNPPIVFVFHGHGGNIRFMSSRLHFEDFYKEAITVYLEGLPGRKVPMIDPKGILNGWQITTDDLGGRDVQFFDKVYEDLQEQYQFDKKKVFLIGHSNGARFVNILWRLRGNKITAICSASAQGGEMIKDALPISVWMYMGKSDKIVAYNSQLLSVPIVKKNLGITQDGIQKGDKTYFKGINNTELVLQESDSGHEFPKESIPEIIQFFQNCAK